MPSERFQTAFFVFFNQLFARLGLAPISDARFARLAPAPECAADSGHNCAHCHSALVGRPPDSFVPAPILPARAAHRFTGYWWYALLRVLLCCEWQAQGQRCKCSVRPSWPAGNGCRLGFGCKWFGRFCRCTHTQKRQQQAQRRSSAKWPIFFSWQAR